MKVYDCITYCGEDLLLKIRFETLFNKVDKFVIVEANKYFNGDSKPKLFNIKNFYKFKEKIDFYYIEDLPKFNGNNLEYEYFIKDQIKRGLKNLNPDDIVLISDADEIPNLENEKYKNFDSTVFLQNMYYYKFNIHLYEGLKWNNKVAATKSCKFKYFESVQKVRRFRVKNIPWWRFDKKINRYVENDGGWHFSYLMSPIEISSKLKRFEHEIAHLKKNSGYDMDELVNVNKIENKILSLQDPYDRKDIKLKKVKIDNTFPDYIVKNIKNLTDYIA